MTTRILIVDDHAIMREGLRAILQTDLSYTIVGEAANGTEAVEMADRLSPDVVIMDIAMEQLNGLEATRRILADNPKTRVIALSAYCDKQFVLTMLEAGAAGYVLKHTAGAELLRAIAAVMRGKKYLSPDVSSTVVENVVLRRVNGDLPFRPDLSGREREVLQLVAEGRSSPEIAQLLFLSVKTVETHRRNIMEKLNLHSVAELTKYAVRQGLTALG